MNYTVAHALFLALCPDCGCGRWAVDERGVDLWLMFHACGVFA